MDRSSDMNQVMGFLQTILNPEQYQAFDALVSELDLEVILTVK